MIWKFFLLFFKFSLNSANILSKSNATFQKYSYNDHFIASKALEQNGYTHGSYDFGWFLIDLNGIYDIKTICILRLQNCKYEK